MLPKQNCRPSTFVCRQTKCRQPVVLCVQLQAIVFLSSEKLPTASCLFHTTTHQCFLFADKLHWWNGSTNEDSRVASKCFGAASSCIVQTEPLPAPRLQLLPAAVLPTDGYLLSADNYSDGLQARQQRAVPLNGTELAPSTQRN